MRYSLEEYTEMQRRLRKLKEAFEADKIQISSHLAEGFKESLGKVRYKDNGDVDLDTVDARIRTAALAITVISDREELKEKNPLYEIQQVYFDYVDGNFREFHEIMVRKGMSPHEAGLAAKNSQASIDDISGVASKFTDSISELWEYVKDPCKFHLEDLRCLKGVFGGGISPSYLHNIVSTCGFYLDTILLPDPFLRIAPLINRWSDKDRAYYFMKHAMILMNYKDSALVEVDPPLVAVVPDDLFFDEHQSKLVWKLGEEDAVKHGSKIFGRKFTSIEEFINFTDSLNTMDKLIGSIHEPSRLIYGTKWTGTIEDQIKESVGAFAKVGANLPVGRIIAMQCVSQMVQANDILLRSQKFRGIPLIDDPTSWRHLTWKFEYDNDAAFGTNSIDTQVVAGLQNAVEGEMKWIGNIPHEALVELRKTGGMDEIRAILRQGITNLETMDGGEFQSGAKQAVDNLKNIFKLHEQNLKHLKKRAWKFAGKDIGSWLAIGTVEVAAVATGMPLYGLTAILGNQLLDTPKFRELIPKAKSIKTEMDKLKRSPVGLLFAHN